MGSISNLWQRLVNISLLLMLAVFLGFFLTHSFAPSYSVAATRLVSQPVTANIDAKPIAAWFGVRQTGLQTQVVGIIYQANNQGTAVLQVGGQPARAFKVEDEIAPGVQLVQVAADYVLIRQDGIEQQVSVAANPVALLATGIARVTEDLAN